MVSWLHSFCVMVTWSILVGQRCYPWGDQDRDSGLGVEEGGEEEK